MATININVGSNDVININVAQTTTPTAEPTKEEIDTLYAKLRTELVHKSNNAKHSFWYEVFIDFSEAFDDSIYPLIKDLPYEAAFDLCWGYLQRRDDYYASPSYVEDLNKALKSIKDF